MRPFYPTWMFGIALSVLGISSTIQSALAQATYTFSATYDALSAQSQLITPDISARTIYGESNNAPFGLTKASGLLYVQTDLTNSSYRFSTNPATFGLQGKPLGGVTLFGDSENKLFYSVDNGAGTIDIATLSTSGSNTANITGGEGLFSGATGTLTGSEVYQVGNLLVDPTSPSRGSVFVRGTISVLPTQIPESRTTAALVGTGVIMTVVMLRKKQKIFN